MEGSKPWTATQELTLILTKWEGLFPLSLLMGLPATCLTSLAEPVLSHSNLSSATYPLKATRNDERNMRPGFGVVGERG